MAGIRKTGLLAANVFRTFPAFICKNALAANNGNWGACRFSIADCRLTANTFRTNMLCRDQKPKSGSFIVKERGFRQKPGRFAHEFHKCSRI